MTEARATKPVFLLLLAALATALLVLIVAPFAGALFAAAVFAGVAHPLQVRLRERLGGRPRLAAGALTLTVTLVVVAPLAWLSVRAAEQVTELFQDVDRTWRNDGFEGVVQLFPPPLHDAVRYAGKLLPGSPGSNRAPSDAGDPGLGLVGGSIETVAGIATAVLDSLASLLIDFGVLILAFFFLLSQGDKLVAWIVDVLPLSRAQSNRLVGEFRDVTRGVFVAAVATALLQTIVAAIGYVIVGLPYLPTVTLLTFVAALVPVVGGAMIAGAAGAWLLLSGDTYSGSFLLVWGLLPVGLSDNLAKPWLAQDALRLPGSIVLFAMLGGLAVFGPMGVVAGPLIVAFFLAALRLLRQEGIVANRESASAQP